MVVTGGASGLGLAMARHFASQGHRVTVLDVDAESGLAAAAEISSEYPRAAVAFKKCDVSSWESQAAAFKETYREAGRIDFVMANAGVSEQGSSSLAALDEDEPSQPRLRALDVNLVGTIYCESPPPPPPTHVRTGRSPRKPGGAHGISSCQTRDTLRA